MDDLCHNDCLLDIRAFWMRAACSLLGQMLQQRQKNSWTCHMTHQLKHQIFLKTSYLVPERGLAALNLKYWGWYAASSPEPYLLLQMRVYVEISLISCFTMKSWRSPGSSLMGAAVSYRTTFWRLL